MAGQTASSPRPQPPAAADHARQNPHTASPPDRNGGRLHADATLSGRQLDRLAPLDDQACELLRQALNEMGLSARAYDKVRRLARTIADLAESEAVRPEHVAEAICAHARVRDAFWRTLPA